VELFYHKVNALVIAAVMIMDKEPVFLVDRIVIFVMEQVNVINVGVIIFSKMGFVDGVIPIVLVVQVVVNVLNVF
jgi:hypothetical protein